jgi:hypothetical protein
MEQGYIENPMKSKEPKIAGSFEGGKYQARLENIRHSGMMDDKINKLKKEFGNLLENADFLGKNDWEMMAVLEEYDRPTLEHCMETYRIAKEKVEKPLMGDNGEPVILSERMRAEEVSLEQFYRTCLLHDIGKVEIPKFVLNNELTDEDWKEVLDRMIKEGKTDIIIKKIPFENGEPEERGNLEEYLKRKNIRPKDLVPVGEVFGTEEIAELENLVISPDESLGEIMKRHELASRRILNEAGYPVEGELAGQHHNYQREKINCAVTVDSLRLSAEMADLLRLADIEQALNSNRPYARELGRIDILAIIIQQSEGGLIGKEITRLWIRDELTEVKEEYAYCIERKSNASSDEEPDDKCDKVYTIKNFLEKSQ